MLPEPALTSQSRRRIGVGIDTARSGHYAAFLRDDLQPAADELSFAESAAGYALLRQRLDLLAHRHGPLHFVVRLDAADQYADNLVHFLHRLATPGTAALAASVSSREMAAPGNRVAAGCGTGSEASVGNSGSPDTANSWHGAELHVGQLTLARGDSPGNPFVARSPDRVTWLDRKVSRNLLGCGTVARSCHWARPKVS